MHSLARTHNRAEKDAEKDAKSEFWRGFNNDGNSRLGTTVLPVLLPGGGEGGKGGGRKNSSSSVEELGGGITLLGGVCVYVRVFRIEGFALFSGGEEMADPYVRCSFFPASFYAVEYVHVFLKELR
jgi:hypothetical protein